MTPPPNPDEKKRSFRLDSLWMQRIALFGGLLVVMFFAVVLPRINETSEVVTLTAPSENIVYSGPSYLYAIQNAPERSANFPLMYQTQDERWSGEEIGDTGWRIGEAGSLACVLAYDQPGELLPSEINSAMYEAGAYTDGGGVDWSVVSDCFTPMRYTEHREFDSDLALNSLKAGKSVLILVADEDSMALWLWLAATENGQYVVYNPASGDIQPETLESYGRVYMLVVGELV